MELIFRFCLLLSGIINFIPIVGAFLPNKMKQSYGIEFSDPNLELLLRHRAVLFGIIGGIMICSAFCRQYYDLSFGMGIISMGTFIFLFKLVPGKKNHALTKIMKIDLITTLILLGGFALFKYSHVL